MKALKISLIAVALSIPLLFAGASHACPLCQPSDKSAAGNDHVTARESSANRMLVTATVGGLAIAGGAFVVVRVLNGKQRGDI
jgi:hypothetical protein